MTNGYFTLSTEAFLRENAFHLVVYVFTRTKVPVHITFSVYMIRSNIKGNVFFKRSYRYWTSKCGPEN